MIDDKIINWLLEGDPSIQYQVNRDLLDTDKPKSARINFKEGWGAKYLITAKSKWALGTWILSTQMDFYSLHPIGFKKSLYFPKDQTNSKYYVKVLTNEMLHR